MSEDVPFGSRGGASLRHHFPLDGEYIIRVGLQGNRREPQEVDVRIDGARVGLLRVGRWSTEDEEDPLYVRFPARAGIHDVSVTFAERTGVTEGVAPSHLPI